MSTEVIRTSQCSQTCTHVHALVRNSTLTIQLATYVYPNSPCMQHQQLYTQIRSLIILEICKGIRRYHKSVYTMYCTYNVSHYMPHALHRSSRLIVQLSRLHPQHTTTNYCSHPAYTVKPHNRHVYEYDIQCYSHHSILCNEGSSA